MFQCIGLKRVRRHSNDPGILVQCTNKSETPSNPDKPQWGWMCSECANGFSQPHPLIESSNVGAMQVDPEEFRDQISSGFMAGMRQSNGEEDE